MQWKHHEMVGKVEGDPCRCPTRPTLVLHDGEQPKTQSFEMLFTDLSGFLCFHQANRSPTFSMPMPCSAWLSCPTVTAKSVVLSPT